MSRFKVGSDTDESWETPKRLIEYSPEEYARFMSEFAIFFAEIEKYLPDTFEMAQLGKQAIGNAVRSAYVNFRPWLLSQSKKEVVKDITWKL